MSWKSHPEDSGTALAPHGLLEARLPIKNLQFWSILEAQAGNRKSATGRHRNSSAATRAHGRSFAIQKLSVLDCLWSCRARGGNLIPSTSETIAAPHERMDACLTSNCKAFSSNSGHAILWLGNRYATDQGNGPGTAWAPGRSFANQNPLVLERFGAPWPWATNLLPGDSGIALVPPELLDARLLIKKHSVFERCGTPDPETEYQLPGDLEAVRAPLGLLEACSPIVQPSVFKLSGTPKP